MNLPNKFKFKWHGNRGDYIYEDGTVTSFDCGHEYKTYFPNASQLVESGEWTIAKDLDEPELVFPFTFQTNSRILYTAEDKMGRVVVSWDDFGSGKGAISGGNTKKVQFNTSCVMPFRHSDGLKSSPAAGGMLSTLTVKPTVQAGG